MIRSKISLNDDRAYQFFFSMQKSGYASDLQEGRDDVEERIVSELEKIQIFGNAPRTPARSTLDRMKELKDLKPLRTLELLVQALVLEGKHAREVTAHLACENSLICRYY